MQKNKQKVYKDGIVDFYVPKDEYKAKNITSKEQLKHIYRSSYCEETIRIQDEEFALSNGKKISLKISIRYTPLIDSIKKAIIDNVLYDLCKVDSDKKKESFIYLERVRKLERKD